MTNQEINHVIAEFCGYKFIAFNKGWITCGDAEIQINIPDYCNDLNAMHEAEKNLIRGDPGLWECYTNRLNTKYGIDAIHATARERAEAFLKTIGKWKD